MSHPEQLGFFEVVQKSNAKLVTGGKIIEIGSYNVNGSVRSIFESADEYVGLDLTAGPGVDLVEYGHKAAFSDGYFDVAISADCFEHDNYWQETFTNMARMVRPGGLLAFTCAGRGFPEHGTQRTQASDSPGSQEQGTDYYKNLTVKDFESTLNLSELFSTYKFWYMPTTFGLYFAGVRSGDLKTGVTAKLPLDVQIMALRQLMPLPHRVVRLPLRTVLRFSKNEEQYQNFAVKYWYGLLKAQDLLAKGRYRRSGAA